MTAVFLAMFGLQIKHFLFDFCFQTSWMISAKKQYGSAGGIVHASLHALGTFSVLIMFIPLSTALALCFAEAVVHYHIDWLKEKIGGDNKKDSHRYWIVFGADQTLHQVTMLAILMLAFPL